MTTEFFRFQPGSSANVIELTLPESLEAVEFDALNEALLKLLDGRNKQKWVIDLSAVTYMGSAMLGMLVNLRQQIKSGGGTLVLFGLTHRLMEIFHTCCMERLFTIVKTREAAMSANR